MRRPSPDLTGRKIGVGRAAGGAICLALLGLCIWAVRGAPSGFASPSSGGTGVATAGWVTTLFLEPIDYESSDYYYDQNNQQQYADHLFHHGVDISGGCVAGTYPVYAAADGTVALAQYINDGYGTQVAIDHGYNIGGNGRYTYTFYGHMGNRDTGQEYIVVSPGQYVHAGQIIGYQGNDGSAFGSCEPNPGTHLDWEVRVSSTALSYNIYMRYGGTAASPDFYTYQQLSYDDPNSLSYVSAGPFGGDPPTRTPVPTQTSPPLPTATPTPGPCGMRFSDLPDTEWSYQYVAFLYCRNIISGYADGTFRPAATSTRAQFAKMMTLGFGWELYNPIFATYADVPVGSTFYQYVETASMRGIIAGYPCGGAGEPCDAQNTPYFRPGNAVSRAQLAKMLVLARNWSPTYPPHATFPDVPSSHWAFGYVETAYSRGLISGYGNGTFGPDDTVTRAQLSKMLSIAIQLGLHSPESPRRQGGTKR